MDPFIGEIRAFGFTFAPSGWAVCNGQTLPISQNTSLFALIGTTYGGDGKTTFGLPNLQGSAPLNQGQGNGLSDRELGESGGESTVQLTMAENPIHTHPIMGTNLAADTPLASPTGAVWGPAAGRGTPTYSPSPTGNPQLYPGAFGVGGGGQPHNNMPPYLPLYFCIALVGITPPRP